MRSVPLRFGFFDVNDVSSVQASLDDLVVFMTFKAAPAASLKSVSRWYKHIHALLSGSFPGAPGGVKLATAGKNAGGGNNNNNNNAGGKKDKKKDKKQEKPKEEPKPKKAEPTVRIECERVCDCSFRASLSLE